MLPDRYNTRNLTKAIKHPSLLFAEFHRGGKSIRRRWEKFKFEREYGHGTNIMSKDWDYLIILDACRYDIFKSVHKETSWLEKEPEFVISKGSHSEEFANENFVGSFHSF